jgi:NitT/TauT family transport system substrate-binding protein
MSISFWRTAAAIVFAAMMVEPAVGQSIKVGYTPRLPQMPLYIANDKGFFKEEKVDVTLVPSSQPAPRLLPLLARGDLDVVFGGPSASVFNAFSEGIGFRIVADGGQADPSFSGYPYSLVVRKDLFDKKEFNSLADLKGKTVSFGTQGTTLAYMMFQGLARAGIDPKDVNIRYTKTMPDIAAMLTNHGIDASAMIPPFDAILQTKGIGVIWKDVRELAPHMQVYVLIFSQRLADNLDLSKRFLRAYLKAVRWYQGALKEKNPELIAIAAKWTKMPPAAIKVSAWTYYDKDGRLNIMDIKNQQATWVRQGLVNKPADIEQLVDLKPLEAALKGFR